MNIFDFFGSAVCHQIAERSFILGGETLPVCARCTGIYSGVFFSMLFFVIFGRLNGNKPYATLAMIIGACSFIPISIDGFFSYAGFWESNQFLRMVTGTFAGVCLPGFMILGANFDVIGDNNRPIYKSASEELLLILVTLLWGILIWLHFGNYFLVSVVIVGGIICFWTNFLYLIIKNLAGKRDWHCWRLAFCTGMIFILSIGVLRL